MPLAIQPHGPLEQVLDDVFVVRGSFPMGPGVRIPRTMTVLRRGQELTVLNSVRVGPEVEASLTALGAVKHLVRLGRMHGADDGWYVERFRPRTWGLPGETVGGAAADAAISESDAPIDGARFVVLGRAKLPEAALHVEGGGGLLVTCDAVQNLTDARHASALGKVVGHLLGFAQPCGVVPLWRRAQGGAQMRPDVERLLERPFEDLVTGHGPAHLGGAREAVARGIERAFGPGRGAG